MGTPLSSLGSRFAEQMRAVDRAPAAPDSAESAESAGQVAPQLSAGELISRHADDLATLDKVAQSLGQAIHQALNISRAGHVSWNRNRFNVEVWADYKRMRHLVQVEDPDPWNQVPVQTYVVNDETLARYTTSVSTFGEWVRAVADRIQIVFKPEPLKGQLDTATHVALVLEHRALTHRAQAELVKYGFELWGASRVEELEAIESIRRALG